MWKSHKQKMVQRKFGSRGEVMDGLCIMTRGGLTKDDMILSKNGKIVSKKKSEAAKKNYEAFGFAKRKAPEEKRKRKAPEEKRKRKRRKKKVEQVEE